MTEFPVTLLPLAAPT